VKYLHYKLSEGVWGTNPYDAIAALGGLLDPSSYVAVNGYRLGYATGDFDPGDLSDDWDVTEITQSEALTFALTIWDEATVRSNGYIEDPPRPEPPEE